MNGHFSLLAALIIIVIIFTFLQIGNWSRWLSDIFTLEDDTTEHSDIIGDSKRPKIFKAFRLLHALSDLMMLPFGMLADASTRNEVSRIPSYKTVTYFDSYS